MRGSVRVATALLAFVGTNRVIAAGADPAATVVFSAPASDGAAFTTSAITLSGTATAASGGVVTEVDLAVDTAAGAVADQTAIVPDAPGSTLAWSWAPALTTNGRYTLSATVLTAAATTTQATVSFIVDVAPQPPSGVHSLLDPASRTVSLTWSPNPEPDLISYLILRSGPGSGLAPLNIVAAGVHGYRDTQVAYEPPGTYRYAVVAIRAGGMGSRTDPSRPSLSTSVTITTAPVPTKVWGHPAPTGTTPAAASGRGTSAPAGSSAPAGAVTAPASPVTTAAPTGPDATAASTPGPATTAASTPGPAPPGSQAAGHIRVATHGSARRTWYEILDAVLIASVLLLFFAVRREPRVRAVPLDALEPDGLLGGLATGAPITVGEAMARRIAPPPGSDATARQVTAPSATAAPTATAASGRLDVPPSDRAALPPPTPTGATATDEDSAQTPDDGGTAMTVAAAVVTARATVPGTAARTTTGPPTPTAIAIADGRGGRHRRAPRA